MEIIISYDVDKNSQTEVKSALLKHGFKDQMPNGNNIIYNLPNTTLWHPALTYPQLAKQIFEAEIQELNKTRKTGEKITPQRFVACGISMKSGIPGEEHSE